MRKLKRLYYSIVKPRSAFFLHESRPMRVVDSETGHHAGIDYCIEKLVMEERNPFSRKRLTA